MTLGPKRHLVDRNPITGAMLLSKPNNAAYDEGYDRIFGKKRLTKQTGDSNENSKDTPLHNAEEGTDPK